jgi:hypothetical protein
MIIALAHEQLDNLPTNQNVALSHFGWGGCVTVGQVLGAIAGRPGNDYVNLTGPVDQPEISVCTKSQLGRFFTLG